MKLWQHPFSYPPEAGSGGDPPPEPVPGAEPRGADDDLDHDTASLAVDDGKGNKMVPLSALMDAKKSVRALSKKVKDLEPVAQRVTEIDGRLQKAQPIIDAVLANPKLRAEALKIAQGTAPSRATTDQPTADEDPDAVAYAEDMGWYLQDGTTPDAARGRRVLARLDQRHGRQTDERIRPFATLTVEQKKEQNLARVKGQVDEDGTPLVTEESVNEVAAMLPAHLLADPNVSQLLLTTAIGLDRQKKRTPKPVPEPMYLERPAGRGPRESVISADERAMLKRVGLSEDEYKKSNERLEQTAPGKAVRLG